MSFYSPSRVLLVILFIIFFIGMSGAAETGGFYTIPVMALTNSPGDGVSNYFSNRPIAPSTVANAHHPVIFPVGGTITVAEIYDYSGTAGTAEPFRYYIRINNANDYLINNLSVATNERVFSNTTLNIAVKAGDYFEIKRVHPTWATNPLTNIVGGYIGVNTSGAGYYVPMQALTSSPADSVPNYMGFRPVAPSTAQGTNKFYIPAKGLLKNVSIHDNSSGAQPGTAEAITYYLQKNGGDHTRIGTIAVGNTSPQRIFNGTDLNINLSRGDYVEFRRDNPLWVVNPLLNIVGGGAYVDTSANTVDNPGYLLYVQALTSSPVDAQTVYIGSKPAAPDTTAARSKVYVRNPGTINRVELYVYSGTAGTAENWPIYLRKNGATNYLIATVNASASERRFVNNTLGVSMAAGDYFQIMGVQPTWATNPATTIYGGYVVVDTGTAGGGVIPTPTASPTSTPRREIIEESEIPYGFAGLLLAVAVIVAVMVRKRGKEGE